MVDLWVNPYNYFHNPCKPCKYPMDKKKLETKVTRCEQQKGDVNKIKNQILPRIVQEPG